MQFSLYAGVLPRYASTPTLNLHNMVKGVDIISWWFRTATFQLLTIQGTEQTVMCCYRVYNVYNIHLALGKRASAVFFSFFSPNIIICISELPVSADKKAIMFIFIFYFFQFFL